MYVNVLRLYNRVYLKIWYAWMRLVWIVTDKFKIRRRDMRYYAKQIRNNPHVYCYNDCMVAICSKHKSKCPYDGEYLFAMLKDTPYCPCEDIEAYEKEE